MSPDEENNQDDTTENAGEHKVVPSTFAGRKRAAAETNGADSDAAEEAPEGENEDLRVGFTEEFDSIEADLDAELSDLKAPEVEEPKAEIEEPEAEEPD